MSAFNRVVFTNGDVTQQLTQLAAYLNQLGYPVDIDVGAALEKQSAADLLRTKLLPGCSLFWTEPSGLGTILVLPDFTTPLLKMQFHPPGFQRILNLLLALLQLDEENISHNIVLIVEPMLASPTEKLEEKQYFLGQLFNTLRSDCPARLQVLKYLVQLNIGAGDIEKIASDLCDEVCQILKQCKATAEQQQQLFSTISDALESENPMLSFDYDLKLLAASDGTGAKSIAKRVLQKSLQLASFFDYSKLLMMTQINQVKQEKLYDLVEILVGGTEAVQQFQEFCDRNGNVFQENGLSKDQITRKMQLLSLCDLAASVVGTNQSLSYEKVSEKVKMKVDQVESLLVEASCLNLMDCKLDQSNSIVYIQCVRDTKFGSNQWIKLEKLIQNMRDKISTMVGRVERAKPVIDSATDPVELIGR